MVFSFLLATPLLGNPDRTFEVWASYSYTWSELHMVGYENENVTVITSPSIHFENVRMRVEGMWIELKSADAENFYLKAKYMETDIIVLNLLPLSHIIINGSHVDQGIPLIGGLMGLQTCQTVDAHMYPPLTWLVQMQNTYIVAEELRLSLVSENVKIHLYK
ncbi:MAG: hypothetical protein QW084_01970 [Candidatus Hadarchaeales archaeon]